MQVSVIIPNYNRGNVVGQTLSALATQTLAAEAFEVIIVDDGSTDDSVAVVGSQKYSNPLELLQQTNSGAGAARNRGARSAKGKLYVFLDADMIPSPGLLERYLVTHLGRPYAIIIGRQLPWAEAFTSHFDRTFNYVIASDLGPHQVKAEWYHLASGNFAIGAQVFEQLGGFDEQLRMTEDTELAYRAYQQSIEFIYDPTAVGYHNHPKTLEQLCIYTHSSAWWTAQLIRMHPEVRGQLPVYRDVEPIALGKDPACLIARKVARQLLAQPIALKASRIAAKRIQHTASRFLFEFLYWKILNNYRWLGFRNGLRTLPIEGSLPQEGAAVERAVEG